MAALHPELHSSHPHRVRFAFGCPVNTAILRSADAEEHAPSYVLLKHGSLEPGEFERPELSTVEIMGFWGSTVLFACHRSPSEDFLIGESSKLVPVDFAIPM